MLSFPGLDRPDPFPIPIFAPASGAGVRLSLLSARPRMPASQALPDGQGDGCVRHDSPPSPLFPQTSLAYQVHLLCHVIAC